MVTGILFQMFTDRALNTFLRTSRLKYFDDLWRYLRTSRLKYFDDLQYRRVWDVFTSNRGLDRHSLYFTNLPNIDNLDLPPAKPKKVNYEWYAPKGVLKKNWINKHQNVIPSGTTLNVFNYLQLICGKILEFLFGQGNPRRRKMYKDCRWMFVIWTSKITVS